MKQKTKITFSPAFFVCWGCAVLLEPNVWLGCIAGAMAWHEAGHLLLIYATGGGINGLRFRAAGLEIVRAAGLRSYLADAAVSLAGPIFSIIGALSLALSGHWRFFGAASLMLGLLNLLPIRGLDGGEGLFALLCLPLGPERAGRILRGLSLIFAVLLWMLAVWIMLVTGGNFSLFVLSVFLFVSVAFDV